MVFKLPVHSISMWVNLQVILHFTAEAVLDRWHSWPATCLRNESVCPSAISCSVLTLHWRLCVWRQRTEPVLFRPVTAANLTDSCALSTSPSPFLSTEELQGVTLRPSGLRLGHGPHNQTRAGAVTVWLCDPAAPSKNTPTPPCNGTALFSPDLSTRHSPHPHPHWLLHPFLPLPVCGPGSFAARVQPGFFLSFFFELNPDDPVSGP